MEIFLHRYIPNSIFAYWDCLLNVINFFLDLDWLDAQADLSILDESKGLNLQPFQIEDPLNLEDAADLLLDLIDNSNLDSSYLSSDISKNDLNNILNPSTQIKQQDASPLVPDFSLSSPYYESISEACSPASCSSEILNPCPSPGGVSSYSSIDDGGYESISEAFTPASTTSSGVTVTVCNNDMDTSSPEETLSIEEVTKSVRKRRFVKEDGKDIPKVHVTLKNVFHPYAKPATTKRSGGGKRERKKIQNKEAAARYRVKKRFEEQELSGVVEGLEQEQEELNKKHDDLLSEIKYLKKLMREVLQKKGVL